MNDANFLDYAVVAALIAGCCFLLVRFVRQTFGSKPTDGCCGCPDSKGGCNIPANSRPAEDCPTPSNGADG